MKKGIILSMLLVAVLGTTGFSRDQSVVKETRDLSGFTKISFGISGDLYIKIGPVFRVELEGEKSLLEEIETEVSGSKLVIKMDGWQMHNHGKATVWITLPELTGLGLSGSGKAEIKDAVKSEKLDLSVSGSGKILTTDLALGEINVGISGSGDVIIGGNGEAGEGDISVSGSGGFSGEALKIARAEFSISGSGNCTCYVTDNLEASVSGSGNITYTGNPKIDARVSGSGRVKSK